MLNHTSKELVPIKAFKGKKCTPKRVLNKRAEHKTLQNKLKNTNKTN